MYCMWVCIRDQNGLRVFKFLRKFVAVNLRRIIIDFYRLLLTSILAVLA